MFDCTEEALTPRSKSVDLTGLPIGVVLEGSGTDLKTGGNLSVPNEGALALACDVTGASVAELLVPASVESVGVAGAKGFVD